MSETVTMTLTDFLLARIAEDEADARSPHWRDHGIDDGDPIRDHWLAECEAKRRIVAAWDDAVRAVAEAPRDAKAFCSAHAAGLRVAVLLMAAVYADHPDYRDEWKA